ncbi:MAG: DNA-binding protein WhiA [Lachnospiraceae bacterium]|nr:DNA-binding protein WhiA [Lachnospiraceae bacterium]
MSFSSQIKEELQQQTEEKRHCRLAELAALSAVCGRPEKDENGTERLVICTENAFVARKYFTLFRKSLKVYIVVGVQTKNKGSRSYRLCVEGREAMDLVTSTLRLTEGPAGIVDERLCKNSCCMRAALRGYFLACGSMSDPSKGYHLEMATQDERAAEQIIRFMAAFSLEGKMIKRKNHFVVYLKEGEGIADFLKVIGAGRSLLEFENTRILKDMRGRVNRKVNCEAANISKIVAASARQVEDIRLIDRMMGLENLSPTLRQMAYLRLEQPDASLEELGKLADPPVGKSGVNHRLRKLSELAETLR